MIFDFTLTLFIIGIALINREESKECFQQHYVTLLVELKGKIASYLDCSTLEALLQADTSLKTYIEEAELPCA